MYIDKIYTKLYSNKDWNGLNTLMNEIHTFARKNYDQLCTASREAKEELRNELAKELYTRYNENHHLRGPKSVRNYKIQKDLDLVNEMADELDSYGDNIYKIYKYPGLKDDLMKRIHRLRYK